MFLMKVLKLKSKSELIDGGIGKTKGWDSLSHIFIITSIEDRFDINFSSNELFELNSINKLVTAVTKRNG